tara:strand:+ start:445 stop:936 length:492 start_codon:yes stop_codon:yes gene_type:complete
MSSTLFVDAIEPNLSSGVHIAGHVIQVVQGSTNTAVTNSTASAVNTGLSATITPTSAASKILVVVHQNGMEKTSDSSANDLGINLYRNDANISLISAYTGYTATSLTLYLPTISISYLDAPATTSPLTYKTMFRNPDGGGGGGTVKLQVASDTSTITLMEIAQ